jgi:molybdenum cofactor biosynthesis protein B
MTNLSKFTPLSIAILTVSDSRIEATDKSGNLLKGKLESSGHILADKKICKDNIYAIRAIVSEWIVTAELDVVLTTGGTGVTGRDGTPEAVSPLFDKTLDGFGEMFRALSYDEIKTSTLQSRAIAGVANATYVFALPGSPGACRLAWDSLIEHQLNSTTKPCNLVELMPRLLEK